MRWQFLGMVLWLAAALGGCSGDSRETGVRQGYVEGEFALMAAPAAGQLARLQVRRGDQVQAGTPLFTLEQANEQAARNESAERLRAAQERLANLRAGRRAPEQEAVRAQSAQAEAARKLSMEQLAQQERLFKEGFISRAGLDQARANHERDMARVAELEAQQRLSGLPVGRDAEIRAAAADVDAARAALAQSEWRLAQRSVQATGPALVSDTYFVEGEWVPTSRPVLSLLSPANVKVRFFVSETQLGGLKVGDALSLACDGCGQPIRAGISYISRQAEYTPPILYSRDTRSKLVYMLEARPVDAADALRLRPGQPVDVSLQAAGTSQQP